MNRQRFNTERRRGQGRGGLSSSTKYLVRGYVQVLNNFESALLIRWQCGKQPFYLY